ncbi:MAG TPA: hypothetical protein VLL48_04585 [Longimicrobiales bacterium]|nr:hypothetical protein [Longimicrobiales bacterium]
MRTLILTCAALLTTASTAAAQARQAMPGRHFLELRPTAGAVMPTGDQRDVVEDAAAMGLQLAWEQKPNLHFVASFGWSPANHKFAGVTDNDVQVFQYDVGAEFNLIRPLGEAWELKPFLGLGVGGRTYDYDEATFDTNTCQAGYATVGTEFQRGAAALRLEARDYLYCFDDPVLDESQTRNDVALSVGVAYHVGHRR